jgi:hypothetical protein
MVLSALKKSGKPVLNGLYQQLLRRWVQYFLPFSQLEIVGDVPEWTPQIVFRAASHGGLGFDWLGTRYALTNHREFSDHQQRMVRSIVKFLSTRHELLFNRDAAAQHMPIFGGLTEDRYVSTFLDGRVFDDAVSVATLPDRVSEAIEVLRISALSSYEDKRISTCALLFGAWPDACHSVPAQPADALPYSSDLTAIHSFHRICDGLRTIVLVDEKGFMVELVDVQEWAQPFSALELPVPSARRYRTHSQATLCGGHICLVLTPNGEIKIFGERERASAKNRLHYLLQKSRATDLSSAVLESIAQIDGSVVLDLDRDCSRSEPFFGTGSRWLRMRRSGKEDVPRRPSAPRNLEM